jgi:hypothetical protein
MKRILLGILGAGVIGWAIFGAWLWRASDVRTATETIARREFAAVRVRLGGDPWLVRGADGPFEQRQGGATAAPARKSSRLQIMVWRADESRLVTTAIPLWYLKLKEIPARFLLGRAGVELDELGLRPRDLERRGAGVVLDEIFADGDRLLIWTE